MGTLLPLVELKAAILPVPDNAISPVVDVEFVHMYCVLAITEPEKLTGAVDNNAQTIWSATTLTVGIGLTVIEKVFGAPEQVLEIGVTVIKVVMGTLDRLVPVKALMVPVPLRATNPVTAVELVQLYWVLVMGEPEKITGVDEIPLQIT